MYLCIFFHVVKCHCFFLLFPLLRKSFAYSKNSQTCVCVGVGGCAPASLLVVINLEGPGAAALPRFPQRRRSPGGRHHAFVLLVLGLGISRVSESVNTVACVFGSFSFRTTDAWYAHTTVGLLIFSMSFSLFVVLS